MIQFLFNIIKALPLPLRRAILNTVSTVASFIPLREAKIAQLQHRVIFNKTLNQRKMLSHIAQSLAETFDLKQALQKKQVKVTVSNQALIEELFADNRSVLALSAHIGNWELLAAYAATHSDSVHVIGQQMKKGSIQEILSQVRANYGVNTLWRQDREGTKALIKAFQDGSTIGALIDQDTKVKSCFAPFMGIQAKCPSRIIDLAKKYNARIVTSFTPRIEKGSYLLMLEEIDLEKSTEEIVRIYNQRLEDLIREYPEQWVWHHKRWRSRPEGNVYRTKEYIDWLEKLVKDKNEKK